MTRSPIDALDRALDDALDQLPARPAPASLAPRVMAAVHAWEERPWHQRGWLSWPAGWQAASVAAFVVLVWGGVLTAPWIVAAAAPTVSGILSPIQAVLAPSIDRGLQWVDAIRIVWTALVTPVEPYARGVMLFLCLACGACATALGQLASRKVSSS
jgi:hypothetical protein